ncbi:hypothetical protein Hanom_Chr16g01507801 [Helianthus anomalus]
MDEVNEPDENGKISNLLDPDAKKQTFERKSQNLPNLRDENGILLYNLFMNIPFQENYLSSSVCKIFRLPPIADNLSGVSNNKELSSGTGMLLL